MPKKPMTTLLAVLLTLALLPLPTQALTPTHTMFDDVPVEAWYSHEAVLCADAGIMVGTGEGRFSPEKVLTQAECNVLALRLHHLMNGGDGTLPKAPDNWGELTMTLADGTVLTSFGTEAAPLPGMEGNSFAFSWWAWGMMGHTTASNLQATLLSDVTFGDPTWREAQVPLGEWGDAREGPATVTVGDVTIPGTVNCWFPVGPWVLAFHPDDDTQETETLLKNHLNAPHRDTWWRDADYYRSQQGLDITFYNENLPATRAYFAQCVALAAGDLPATVTVDAIPDVEREGNPEIYALYEAGILTGKDAYGAFHPKDQLTRAEAAAMVARVLEPSLRMTEFSPTPLPTEGYTLTYLADGTSWLTYPLMLMEPTDGDSFFLTLDGEKVDWPEGTEEGLPSYGLEQRGDYVFLRPWDRSEGNDYGTKAGLMDGSGNMAIPFGLYDNVWPTGDGHFIGRKTDDTDWSHCFLLSAEKQVEAELPAYYGTPENDWREFNEGLCPWWDEESQLWGYVDAQGAWVVQPVFSKAGKFQNGYAVVTDQKRRMGLMDRQGEMVIPFDNYYSLSPFHNSPDYHGPEGLIWFSFGSQESGWLDLEGNRYPVGAMNGESGPFHNGYCSGNGIYYDTSLKPVSQKFTWTGPIGPDGRGFVGLDGKIYRIQFEQ